MLPYFKGITIKFIIIWFLNQNLPPQTCFSYIYIVYFNLILIQFTLVHFDYIQSIRSYSVHSVNMGPLQSIYWFYSVHFSSFSLIRSILVLSGPYCPLRSCSVQFGPTWSTLVLFCPFGLLGPIRSYSVHFGFILSIQSNLVLLGPLLFYSV